MLFLIFPLLFCFFLVSSTSIIPGLSENGLPSTSLRRTSLKPPVSPPMASLLQTSNLICQFDETNFRCIFLDSDLKPFLKGDSLSSSNISFSSKTMRYLSSHPLIKHNTIVVADSYLNSFRFKTLIRDGELKAFKQVGAEFVRSRKTVLQFLEKIKSVKLSNFKQLYDISPKYFEKRVVENVEELLKPFSRESKHILLDEDFDPIILNNYIATLNSDSFDSLVSYLSNRRSFTEYRYYVATILADGLLISREYVRDSKKESFTKNISFIPRRLNDSLAIFIRNNLNFLDDPSHLWTVIEPRGSAADDANDSYSDEEDSDNSDGSNDSDNEGEDEDQNQDEDDKSFGDNDLEDQESDINDNVDDIRKVESESEAEMKISERDECKEVFIYNDCLVRQNLKRRFDQLKSKNDDII